MQSRICSFTGHRTIYPRHAASLPTQIDALLERVIADGFCEFRTGGAIGFDTLVALKVLEKREKYPNIRLCLYLPCHGQERGWSENLKEAYTYVLERADSVHYSCDSYVTGCMQKRNREMIDGASLCIAYCGSDRGGSAYTVGLARKNGIEVINLF